MPSGQPLQTTNWKNAGLLWFSRNFFWRQEFGARVWKVSVDGGFGCPNRDGTKQAGGCIFCDPESFSPSRRTQFGSITRQIDEGVCRLKRLRKANHFVAYFQPATNTHGPIDRLRALYEEAASHPAVIGLIIGTRPDCMGDDVVDLLAQFSQKTWLSVELGLQTIHDRTLDWIGRGHGYAEFLDAYARAGSRGIRVGAHIILGLPGESRDDMLATARELARLRVASVKLHNLHAVKGTQLARLVDVGEVKFPTREAYVGHVVDFLEVLHPECVIDRLSGDAPPQYLVGPKWCHDTQAIRAAIEAEFRSRGTWQGARGA